jgi:serine/threonine protein kinase
MTFQCIYAVHKKLIFAIDKDTLPKGETVSKVLIERQMSFFADPESLEAFLKHLDADSPWHKVFSNIRARFGKDNPRKPVAMWAGIDPDFRDLLNGLTKFDPDQRLTAHEALAHKWFANV